MKVKKQRYYTSFLLINFILIGKHLAFVTSPIIPPSNQFIKVLEDVDVGTVRELWVLEGAAGWKPWGGGRYHQPTYTCRPPFYWDLRFITSRKRFNPHSYTDTHKRATHNKFLWLTLLKSFWEYLICIRVCVYCYYLEDLIRKTLRTLRCIEYLIYMPISLHILKILKLCVFI